MCEYITKNFLNSKINKNIIYSNRHLINSSVLFAEDNIQLPLKMWFPLDTSQGAGFVIAWAYEIILFVLFTPIYIILHTFYIGLIILTCGQLKLLSSLLSSTKADKPEESHQHLRFCVAMHCRILRCVRVHIIQNLQIQSKVQFIPNYFMSSRNPRNSYFDLYNHCELIACFQFKFYLKRSLVLKYIFRFFKLYLCETHITLRVLNKQQTSFILAKNTI